MIVLILTLAFTTERLANANALTHAQVQTISFNPTLLVTVNALISHYALLANIGMQKLAAANVKTNVVLKDTRLTKIPVTVFKNVCKNSV